MNPRVKTVQPLDNYILEIVFTNSEKKWFDVKPYVNKGVFVELQNEAYFKLAKVEGLTVVWPNEQDFCPDTLYLESKLM